MWKLQILLRCLGREQAQGTRVATGLEKETHFASFKDPKSLVPSSAGGEALSLLSSPSQWGWKCVTAEKQIFTR